MPLISVIIPVYNADKYLERCINSLLNQDFQDFEIVLVNDGSTDNSLKICECFSFKYPQRIKLISQKTNSGASISRKCGVNESAGDYLMFVDSDDYVAPNYLSAHYAAIQQYKCDMAISRVKRIDTYCLPQCEDLEPLRIIPASELFVRFFKYEFWGFPGGCYKRSLFDDIEYPAATVNEDYYVKAQLFCKANSIVYINTPLYFYEQHEGSLSKQTLSFRALGEFDNAVSTHLYVKSNLKEYVSQSLSIAAEVSCKWLVTLNKDKTEKYADYRSKIISFLKSNLYRIIFSPHLLWKTKVVLLVNLLKAA